MLVTAGVCPCMMPQKRLERSFGQREEVERRRTAAVVIMEDIDGRVGNRQEDWEVVG